MNFQDKLIFLGCSPGSSGHQSPGKTGESHPFLGFDWDSLWKYLNRIDFISTLDVSQPQMNLPPRVQPLENTSPKQNDYAENQQKAPLKLDRFEKLA